MQVRSASLLPKPGKVVIYERVKPCLPSLESHRKKKKRSGIKSWERDGPSRSVLNLNLGRMTGHQAGWEREEEERESATFLCLSGTYVL